MSATQSPKKLNHHVDLYLYRHDLAIAVLEIRPNRSPDQDRIRSKDNFILFSFERQTRRHWAKSFFHT